jgi:CRP/FNR family transcriptional regulator
MARLSKELSSDKNLLLSLGKKTAQEKLISFLLSLSQRFTERGYSSMSFQLTMSRGDIANHLGLAIETVSRLFTQLQEQQLLTTQGKEVTILDLPTLKQRCG